MANVQIVPEARTEAALEFVAERFAELFASPSVTGAQVEAELKLAGTDMVGWSRMGKVFYRAQAKAKATRNAADAQAALERMEAREEAA